MSGMRGISDKYDVVIVGAGQAGLQTAMSLVDVKFSGSILLIGDEAYLPYQRPPLSKLYLSGTLQDRDVELQNADYYSRNGIDVMTESVALTIDRQSKRVALSDGRFMHYGFLVLATGARAKTLPHLQDGLKNVFYIRTLMDARRLREMMERVQSLCVIGGGFLGLEAAAIASSQGKIVDLIEGSERILSRSASAPISVAFEREHRRRGVNIITDTKLQQAEISAGSVRYLTLDNGRKFSCDAVLVSAGVEPNADLAKSAGLDVVDGIRVDNALRTSDPAIFAIGDCASYPHAASGGEFVRVESVQNALDQARCVAKTITGNSAHYDQTPIFWTDQYGMRLQVAGLPRGADECVMRGDSAEEKFSVYRFKGDQLMCVESLNAQAEHMLARKLFANRILPTKSQVADQKFDLKSLLLKAA